MDPDIHQLKDTEATDLAERVEEDEDEEEAEAGHSEAGHSEADHSEAATEEAVIEDKDSSDSPLRKTTELSSAKAFLMILTKTMSRISLILSTRP